MSYIKLSNIGKTPFERLLGNSPNILKNWDQLELAFFQSATFTPEFLEQVRRALAFKNQCQYCMAKAGPVDENIEDTKLKMALRFANLFAIDHLAVEQQEVERLKQYFSDPEVIELIAFCCFISASQRFGAVLGLEPVENYF